MTRRTLFVAVPLALFLGLLALLASGLGRDPEVLPSPLVGRAAPAFTLARLDAPAQHFGPEAMRGQVWLLNVWASWCTSCRKEHPALMDLARSGLLPIVGLDYADAPEDGQRWLAEHGNPYAVVVQDPEGRTGIDYGVYGVPETYVIDRGGVIRFKHTGPLTPQLIEQRLLPLIKELQRG